MLSGHKLSGFLKTAHTSQQQALAIYFHDRSVCAVWLDAYAGRQHLLAAVCVPCFDAVVQGQIVDQSKLAQAIHDAYDAIGAPDVPIIACVADDAVMTTSIELPAALSDEDVEAQILIDAERYIGRALDEVYFDFKIVSTDAVATTVSLTVAYRAAVDECVEVLAMAGIEASVIDVQSLCMAQIATRLGDRQVTALIDVDTEQIHCHIAQQSFLWSQTQPLDPMLTTMISGADLVTDVQQAEPASILDALDFSGFMTQRVRDADDDKDADDRVIKAANDHHDNPNLKDRVYEISFDDEDLFFDRKPAACDASTYAQIAVMQMQAVDQAVDQIAKQIVRLLNSYQQQYARPIEQVYLMGLDQQRWSGLTQVVTADSGVACQLAHPMLLMDDTAISNVQVNETLAASLMMPTMLALRTTDGNGINLLPWRDEQRSRRAMRFRRMLQVTCIILILLILGLFALLSHQIHHQNAINAEIASKIATVDETLQQIDSLKNQLHSTKERLAAIDGLATDRAMLYRWQKLPLIIPEGVYLDSAKQTGDEVMWTGKAVRTESISAFANALELSGMYGDVLVVSLQQVDQVMGFSISATELLLQPEDMQTLAPINLGEDIAKTSENEEDVDKGEAGENE